MSPYVERGQRLDPAGAATLPPPAMAAPPLPRALMVPRGPARDAGRATVALTCDECGDRHCPVWAALALERPTVAELQRAHRMFQAGTVAGWTEAIEAVRDGERFEHWWTFRSGPFTSLGIRLKVADYLDAIRPTGGASLPEASG